MSAISEMQFLRRSGIFGRGHEGSRLWYKYELVFLEANGVIEIPSKSVSGILDQASKTRTARELVLEACASQIRADGSVQEGFREYVADTLAGTTAAAF